MSNLIIQPPLFMIGMKIPCWRCETRMPVIALLAPKVKDTEEQICVISDIEAIPRNILSFIQQRVPTFKLKHSMMAGKKYYANTCPKCRVLYGDFFLHAEPGAPFFPTDEEDAKLLYIKEIPISKTVSMNAGLNLGLGKMILSNANRI